MISRIPFVTYGIALMLAVSFSLHVWADSNFSSTREKDGWKVTLRRDKLEISNSNSASSFLVPFLLNKGYAQALKQVIEIAEKWQGIAGNVKEPFAKEISADGPQYIFEWAANKGPSPTFVAYLRIGDLHRFKVSDLPKLKPLLEEVPAMEAEVAAKDAPFVSAAGQTEEAASLPDIESLRPGAERKLKDWTVSLQADNRVIFRYVSGQYSYGLTVNPNDKEKLIALIKKADEWEATALRINAKSFKKVIPGIDFNGPVTFKWWSPSTMPDANTKGAATILLGNNENLSLTMLRQCPALFDLIPEMQKESADNIEQARRQDEQFK